VVRSGTYRKRCSWLVLLATVLSGFAVAGCESVDPTEQSMPVLFRDDLRRPVTLSLCADSACKSFDYTDNIAAGGTDSENISDRGILTRWLVAEARHTLGCLPLEFTGKYSNLTVQLSRMVRCPGEHPIAVHHGRKVSGEV
jgi:hypothetical protein